MAFTRLWQIITVTNIHKHDYSDFHFSMARGVLLRYSTSVQASSATAHFQAYRLIDMHNAYGQWVVPIHFKIAGSNAKVGVILQILIFSLRHRERFHLCSPKLIGSFFICSAWPYRLWSLNCWYKLVLLNILKFAFTFNPKTI